MKPEDFIALCAFYHEETGMKSLSQLCATLYDAKNVNVTEEEGTEKKSGTNDEKR
ncbi:hypothetical protein [Aneurinibacillus aneurinilyticus]|uniref:Uncharacterized protein n=1 Tax=Aneurinibacillus aneurinilyticus ATCC 12856 TaxID=649747 RepID=U1Y974_ANEAE|nr:hypothetical protein [Aneurinibacillus aneurinilyticus]ERI07361.1 hypothetical protein HMPREF0083_04542 [Aneurinibacillus aneurinilyticus ATCC 12856]